MNKYWDKGIDYTTYLNEAQTKIEDLKINDKEHPYFNYYELGLTRMQRVNKTYTPNPTHLELLKNKNWKGKILIISEAWCGDAAMIVPVIAKFFEGHNEVKIVYRDENEELINQYLTNGGKSIPIVLILNENNEVISHWGPRPKHGMELLKRYKEDPENYNADQFHNDLQIYYTKNKGQDIIDELLEKI